MKMKKFKNYIAFTMMEMTLVLLITSIIAAASTPIITSAVSDYADKNYSGEIAAAPWRKTKSYDGGGIYNSPVQKDSPIGINAKFGSAASYYKYPALAIESMSANNIINSAQIKIRNSSTYGHLYANLGMDEFENVMFVSGNNSFRPYKVGNNGTNTTYIGSRSIYLGSNLFDDDVVKAYNNIYNQNSIFIGQNINSLKSENTVQMGSNIAIWNGQRNNVYLGHNFSSVNNENTAYQGNIQIGNYSNQADKRDTITIGNYAGMNSSIENDIFVGNYAGVNYRYYYNYLKLIGSVQGSKSIFLGKYAGAYYYGSGESSITNLLSGSDSILIGGYAGYASTSLSIRKPLETSIIIGERAGAFVGVSDSYIPVGNINDVIIGNHAGYRETLVSNGELWGNQTSLHSVYIGDYAGSSAVSNTTFDVLHKYNIYLGQDSGAKSNGTDSIFIGSYSGNEISPPNKSNHIAIGEYASSGHGSYGAISIGSYAGAVNRLASVITSYGNVAIGPNACRDVWGFNKWCIGGGGYSMHTNKTTLSDTSGNVVWNPQDTVPQMFIGSAESGAYANTAITLYANTVYKPSATSFLAFSDRRLKTNIVLAKNHLDKLRKVNIYNYNMKDDDHKDLRIGVIAQEYRKVFPDDVSVEPNFKKLAVSTGRLIYTMAGAIKELDDVFIEVQLRFNKYVKDFMGLKSKVAKLEKQAQYLKSQNEQMKSQLAKINSKLR